MAKFKKGDLVCPNAKEDSRGLGLILTAPRIADPQKENQRIGMRPYYESSDYIRWCIHSPKTGKGYNGKTLVADIYWMKTKETKKNVPLLFLKRIKKSAKEG